MHVSFFLRYCLVVSFTAFVLNFKEKIWLKGPKLGIFLKKKYKGSDFFGQELLQKMTGL